MATLQGFQIMKVAFNGSVKSPHYMYFKAHRHQKQNELMPADTTIFVVNVPPYCTKKGLESLFGGFGPIKSIYIQDTPGPVQETTQYEEEFTLIETNYCFKVAYIVFQRSISVKKATESEFSKVCFMSRKGKQIKTGLDKWCSEYTKQYPKPNKVQAKVDVFMAEFDSKEAKEKEELERLTNEPDDDGWTVVTHGKKTPGVVAERVTKRDRKRKQRKELANFYTFQQRESKREHIAVLRKKFEEDKKKIELLRAARKFKPF